MSLTDVVGKTQPANDTPKRAARPPKKTNGGTSSDVPSDFDRCLKYVAKMPGAISGSGGHAATFDVVRAARGFALSEDETLDILHEYNERCEPPWSERELIHKASYVTKMRKAEGYILDKSQPWEPQRQAARAAMPIPDDSIPETKCNSADGWTAEVIPPDPEYCGGGPAEDFERQSPIVLESVNEIFAQLPPVNWLCQDLQLAPGRPNLLAGPGYGGKSIIAQIIGFSVASGQRVFGKFPVQQGKVIHLNYDQGGRVPKSRYQRIMRAHFMAPSDLDGRLFLGNHPPVYLDDTRAETVLMALCEGAALLIVDSFRAAMRTLDENDSRVRGPLNMLIRVSEKTGVTVLVIHHSRKPGIGAAAGKNEIRGSSAIFEACESVYVLDPVKGEPTRVIHEKAGITGMTRPDFLLHVADIEIDGAPRGGLMVTAEEVVPIDADVRAVQARLSKDTKLRAAIAALFENKGDQKGADPIASLLGRGERDVGRVVKLMISEGEILDSGKGKARVLHYLGKQT
jgi:hypothetical protein